MISRTPGPALALAALLAAGCAPNQPPAAPEADAGASALPAARREFRGVWVATVSNIDWPTRPGLPTDSARAELTAILDRAAELRLNAIIFQVRPAADALYASKLEPWSEYLTGTQGKAPDPYWDPLKFAVQQAHRRGLELHAWFNPFRARHTSARSPISPGHVSRTHPDWVVKCGKQLWIDPGIPAARAYSVRVILDVVRRYDIDGVHIDDYFYPYPIADSAGNPVDFPDSASWNAYVRGGGTLSKADWRRGNIDAFIHDLYQGIKRVKPWVKFGISPFAIWQAGHPPQIQGFSSYEKLYADTRRWLRNGWVDYWTPELYWPIAQKAQSYPVLLRWWAEQDVKGRHLWPGNFTSRVGSRAEWSPDEIIGQIYVTRGAPRASGNVHFSMRVFMQDPDSLVEKLEAGPYARPALVPASPWLDDDAPARPTLSLASAASAATSPSIALHPAGDQQPWLWVVRTHWTRASAGTNSEASPAGGPASAGSPSASDVARPARNSGRWTLEIIPGWKRTYTPSPTAPPATDAPLPDSAAFDVADEVAVSAVDRTGNEGAAATLRLGAAAVRR